MMIKDYTFGALIIAISAAKANSAFFVQNTDKIIHPWGEDSLDDFIDGPSSSSPINRKVQRAATIFDSKVMSQKQRIRTLQLEQEKLLRIIKQSASRMPANIVPDRPWAAAGDTREQIKRSPSWWRAAKRMRKRHYSSWDTSAEPLPKPYPRKIVIAIGDNESLQAFLRHRMGAMYATSSPSSSGEEEDDKDQRGIIEKMKDALKDAWKKWRGESYTFQILTLLTAGLMSYLQMLVVFKIADMIQENRETTGSIKLGSESWKEKMKDSGRSYGRVPVTDEDLVDDLRGLFDSEEKK